VCPEHTSGHVDEGWRSQENPAEHSSKCIVGPGTEHIKTVWKNLEVEGTNPPMSFI